MKKIYLMMLPVLLFLAGVSKAQVGSYILTPSSGTFTPVTGGTAVATSTSVADFLGDTRTSISLPIGFTFNFDGINYTNVVAASDGFLSFNLAATSAAGNNLATTAATRRPLVAPLWDDLDGASGSGAASYKTEGVAGSRIFTMEWLNWQWNYAAAGATISFQVKLYEGINKIEFIYRQEAGAVSSASASIGIAGLATGAGNYLSLNNATAAPAVSSTTETTSISAKPATGQIYSFSPNLAAVDYCNLQFPAAATIAYGGNSTVYTQGYEAGVTEPAGQGANINVWIGVSSSNTDPATWTTWVPATYNAAGPANNNDEYMASIGTGLLPGTYYYASRWQFNNGVFKYGGYSASNGGFWDGTTNVSGVLTITPPPAPVNDICSGAIVIPSAGPFPYLTGATGNISATNTADPVPSCQANSNKGVWYTFTPNVTGSYIISSCQSDAPLSNITDNVIAIYTSATGCTGPFTSVACDDDGCTTLANQGIITTNLTAGTQYYILAYGYDVNVGDIQLKITAPLPMAYISSTTTQSSSASVVAGSVNQQIVRLQVVVDGTLNPLTVTQLDLNTTGSTNAATDIASAKVFYTGTSTTFGTTTPFGTPVAAPNGSYSVTGSQVLTGGTSSTTNYFWIVYDIACTATVANVVDGEVTGVTIGGSLVPTVTAPAGTRAITAVVTTATTNQPSTATVLGGTNNNQVLRVQLTSCAGSIVTSLDFNTTGSTNPATDISAARVFYTTTTTFATTTQFGTDVAAPSGAFTVTGSQVLTAGTGYFWLVYDVPLTATATNLLDASNTSSVLNGGPVVPATPNPAGTRSIVLPPPNDEAPGAITITVDATCTGGTYTNVNATMGTNESKIACKGSQTVANQVWFKFVAPASGFVKVSTDIAGGGLTDTRIGLFSATNVNDYSTFVGIACDDDNGATVANTSTLYANNLTPGSTYYVAVDHWNGSGTGTFCLEVREVTSAMLSAVGSCTAGQDLASYNVNYTGWLSATDAAGNLRALLRNPAGTGTTSYTFTNSININTAAVRQSPQTGTFYLDRNYRITNSAATNIEVQFFFLSTELAALTTADGTILPVLAASRQVETVAGCQANFIPANGPTTVLPQTANGSAAGVSWIQVTTPGFGNFYLHNAIRVVPVTIEYFKGSKQTNGNLLDWKVACYNSPTATMVIERSSDARKFEPINSITETATRCLQPFSFVDATPLAGMNYYRLKTIDADGKESYSAIVALLNKTKGFEIVSLMPNPVKETAILSTTSAVKTTMQVVISDLAGRQLSVQSVKLIAGSNQVPLKLGNLSAGTYQVTGITADGTTTTLRFVKE